MLRENKNFAQSYTPPWTEKWITEVRLAYQAVKQVHKNLREESGELGEEGFLDRDISQKMREAFYQFLYQVDKDKLPEAILLNEQQGYINVLGERLTTETGKYYLPRTDEFYIYRSFMPDRNTKKYFPKSPTFIGFDRVKEESPHHFTKVEHQPLSDHSYGFYDTFLYPEDIEKIISHLENHFISLGDIDITRGLFLQQEQEIRAIKEERNFRTEKLKVDYGQNLETLVRSLKNTINKNYFASTLMPKWLPIRDVRDEKFGYRDDQEYFYFTPTGELMIVPQSKLFKGRSKYSFLGFMFGDLLQIHYFKKKRKADIRDWACRGLGFSIANKLVDTIQDQDIRNAITSYSLK